jgi:hypothetical protein
MHDPSLPAAVDAAAEPSVPGRSLTFERRWAASTSEQLEHTRLIDQARHTDAAVQLRRICPSAARALESLSWRALTRLAANQPVDPNDPDSCAARTRTRRSSCAATASPASTARG